MAKPTLAAVAALAATDAQAAEVYSGVLNTPVTWASSANVTVFLDINGGGNDIRFYGLDSSNQAVFRADAVGGGALNGLLGYAGSSIGYPYALGTNYSINASKPWVIDVQNTLANERYGSGYWQNDSSVFGPSGSAFMGIRLSIGGNTHYGWIRITKNDSRSWTIVDFAYDDSPNTPIVTPGVLPVELTALRAQIIKGAAQLFWATASEENNSGFEVQRSEDGKNFETLNFVEGHGTTLEAQEYLFDDKSIKENTTYYYRLKQIDLDGKFEYSDVVTARLEGNADASTFYPNPAVGGITKLNYNTTESGKVNITVYNVSGQAVAELVRTVETGSNVLNFDFSTLSKGNYFVKIENGSDRQYQKLIIE